MGKDENIYQRAREEFAKKYKNEIVPQVLVLEEERKKSLFNAVLFSCLLILASIISYFIINKTNASSGLYKISGFLFILGFLVFALIKYNFEYKIKEKVMPIVCACFPDLRWNPVTRENYDAAYLYKESNLINNFDDISFDDCFYGSSDGVKFGIEECCATIETRNSKGETQKQTVFKGAIVSIDMNKNFKGNTVVRPNSFLNNVLSPSLNLRKTSLEDVEFERKFDVFTDDEIEARYLLTTSFMERLNKIQVAFKADKFSVSFYKEKLYIALHTNKDLFKLGSLLKHVCDEKNFYNAFEEILSIVMLIDHFKLNQKIGL